MARAHAPRDGHSSGTPVARRLEQPTRTAGSGHDPGLAACARRAVPIWSCSRWGLPCRLRHRGRGALLPHRFTLAALARNARGGLFSVALSLGSRPPDVIQHRMSVEPGLSSPAAFRRLAGAAVRPTDLLGMGMTARSVKGRSALRASCRGSGQAAWIGCEPRIARFHQSFERLHASSRR